MPQGTKRIDDNELKTERYQIKSLTAACETLDEDDI